VIPLEVRVAGRARIDVLSVSGRRVATLVDRTLGAGTHEIVWDGLDDNGVPVGSGTYFFQLGNRTKPAHKLTLVR
jgi:flagellar hook assembly protein FlgD